MLARATLAGNQWSQKFLTIASDDSRSLSGDHAQEVLRQRLLILSPTDLGLAFSDEQPEVARNFLCAVDLEEPIGRNGGRKPIEGTRRRARNHRAVGMKAAAVARTIELGIFPLHVASEMRTYGGDHVERILLTNHIEPVRFVKGVAVGVIAGALELEAARRLVEHVGKERPAGSADLAKEGGQHRPFADEFQNSSPIEIHQTAVSSN